MSVITAALRELMAAGLSGDRLIEAIERIEAAAKPARSKHAEAQARYHERKKNRASELITSDQNDHSDQNEGSVPPSPDGPLPSPAPQPSPLNPPSTSTEREGARGEIVQLRPKAQPPPERRATRLPSDFQLTPADIDHARKEGFTDDQIRREFDQFRDHWAAASGANATKRDWHAAWRTWIRKAADRLTHTRGHAAGGYGSQAPSRLRAVQRAVARFRDANLFSE